MDQPENKINKAVEDLQKLIRVIDPNNEIFVETNMLIQEITESKEQAQQYIKTQNNKKE